MVAPDLPAGANPIGQALADGDPAALSAALRTHNVAMPVTEREGAVVPALFTDDAGTRSLAVFTSQEALSRWGTAATVEMVPGHALPGRARSQQVHDVFFDPAGPTPVRFDPHQLSAIADGLVGDVQGSVRLVGELELVPALSPQGEELRRRLRERAAARESAAEVYLVDRLVGRHFVLTVAVHGSDDDFELVRRDVEESSAGIDVVDVLRIDRRTRKALRRHLPASQLSRAG